MFKVAAFDATLSRLDEIGDQTSASTLTRLLTLVGFPALILLVSFAVRLYWIVHHTTVLSGEECEYARIAENLLRRHAYVGLLEGPELMYPPFFPLSIAAASVLTGSFVAAGRAVSLAGGVSLVLIIFLVADHIYGRRTAFIAATIAAVHPLLIFLSGVTYSESLYLPLMMGGIYWGLRSLSRNERTSSILCGTCFGLAYLTRPEALLYPVATSICILLARVLVTTKGRRPWKTVALVLIPPALLASPYVAYLSVHIGSARLEGKSLMNYVIGEKMNGGMDLVHAAYAISDDLSDEGAFLSPNRFVARTTFGIPVKTLVSYWMKTVWRNRKALPEWLVVFPGFGSFFMVGLVAVGLFGRPWSRERLIMESLPLTLGGVYLLLIFGMPFLQLRFLLPLLPFIIIWAAKGIDEVSQWAISSAQQATHWTAPTINRFGTVTTCVLVAGMPLLAIRAASFPPPSDPRGQALRQAGLWLREHFQGPPRLMTVAAEVPYYADGVFLPLPEADEALALKYIRSKAPDFIVLTHETERASYQVQWLKGHVPDASPVQRFGVGPNEVSIYEWHGSRRPSQAQ